MSNDSAAVNPKILIVEDNPIDVLLLKRALESGGYTGQAAVVDDGAPALRFLRGEDPFEDAPTPEMVILDLNLKTVDGPEVLSYIRQTRDLCNMMVVILSSSPEDVMRMKAATADSYITKPSGLAEFLALGKRLLDLYRTRNGESKLPTLH